MQQPPPTNLVTGFRPRADDVRRVGTLLDLLKGDASFIMRLALAHLDRRVQGVLATEGMEGVQRMLAEDKLAVLDPALRQKPGPKPGSHRAPKKARPVKRRAAAPDAQPSAAR